MSAIPTVTVRILCQDAQGRMIAGAMVTAALTAQERCQGLEVPASAQGVTDSYGVVTLSLFPNELGSEGSAYTLTAVYPLGGSVVRFVAIPNAACDIVLGPRVSAAVTVQAILDEVLVARDAVAQLRADVAFSASDARWTADGVQALRGELEQSAGALVAQAEASRDAAARSERQAAECVDLAAGYATQSGIMPAMRDTLGKFPGVIQPSLNLFCPDMTSDVAPMGAFTRSTGGYRMGPTGLYEWVAGGMARREWDYNGNLLGWLLEGGSTNLLPYSQEFDKPIWIKDQVTISPNVAIAPDGSLTADHMTESTGSGAHYFYVTSGRLGTNTLSIFAESGVRALLYLQAFNATDGLVSKATFDLSRGIIIAGSSSTAIIKNMGNGLYRCSIAATVTTTTAYSATLNTMIYVGDGGSGLYIWGAQLEPGSFPTSYIPTTTSAVTRAADVWTISTSSFPFNPNEGTLYAEFKIIGFYASNPIFVIDDGSPLNSISIRVASNILQNIVYSAGNVQANLDGRQISSGSVYRVALSWAANNISSSCNGSIAVTDTLASIPSLTTMRFGSNSNGDYASCYLRHLAYSPRGLSDAALPFLTA